MNGREGHLDKALPPEEEGSVGAPPSDRESEGSSDVEGSEAAVDKLDSSNGSSPPSDDPPHTQTSSDLVDHELVLEKGTFFWVTIGITVSARALSNDMKPIPRWGVGLFFDHNYIPLRFKEPIKDSNGMYYRPEMRFWSQEDAVAFANSIAGKFRFKMDPKVFGNATVPESNIDPVSQALEAVRDSGLQVNNMFQHADGTWRVSLKEENYYDFADGGDLVTAIEAAVHNTTTRQQLSYSAAKKHRR